MIETVIKVGGSLGQSSTLPNLLQKLSEIGRRHKILIVPGGGGFANAIRDYDQQFGVTADAGHWMSILAMDQYGHLLSSMLANSVLVRGLASAREAQLQGRIPVLLSYDLLRDTDALPKNWDVTSDSISAWLAELAGARQLVLLKSVDGLFYGSEGNKRADELKKTESWGPNADYQGVVDHYFSTILEKITMDPWLVNGNCPERLEQLLDTGTTTGTRLLRQQVS
jgi:aspartokinase-like uncharacterized kinase